MLRFRLLLLVALVGLTSCRVQHDNPPLPLNATYHQLDQEVVDRLLKNAPEPPQGRQILCTYDAVSAGYSESYCICYNAKACRDLAESDQCDAKIGRIRPDIGVCRERIQRVTIG